MPQMAPISWLCLYILFTATFILFCMMNYYMTIPQTPQQTSKSSTSLNSMNWKW